MFKPRYVSISDEDRAKVNDIVSYHAPSAEAIDNITRVRDAIEATIVTFMENCPPCADRTAAIRKLREAMMTANASIVLEGRSI